VHHIKEALHSATCSILEFKTTRRASLKSQTAWYSRWRREREF